MRMLKENQKDFVYNEQTFLHLLGLIYDAASNPKLWPVFMEKVDEITDGALIPTFSEDFCPESLSPNVTILQRKPASASGRDVFKLAEKLAPHIQRAIMLHRRLTNLEMEKGALINTLDRLAIGVALISCNGKTLLLNRSARQIVDEKDPIRLENNHLHACYCDQAEEFRQLVSAAVVHPQAGTRPSGGTMFLTRHSAKSPLFLMVTPLPVREFRVGCETAAAALFLSDPENGVQTPEQVLRQLYGLTPAEAHISSLLARGKTVEEAAVELNVSSNTARTHLKRTFFKTETRRQADLIRILLSGPATVRPN
jgi:DNA-binding CsgD family transcriptional regulator